MDCFLELENIIKDNQDYRGMDGASLSGELKEAAKVLIKASTVVIVTGFVIKDKMIGETDGPIGAISLARALDILGKNVVIVTDTYSEEILKASLKLIDIKTTLEIVNKCDEINCAEIILNKYKPDCLVSIERPGKAWDGIMYSMTAEAISDIAPDMDNLFKEAKIRGLSTIGIGDGGNEIGMGKIKDYIIKNIPNGNIIAAYFATDYLILAGVSNWGAHALVAAMSILLEKDLLYNIETGVELLKTMVNIGAVDGLSKKRMLTVDGLSLEYNIKILKNIKQVVEDYLLLKKDNNLHNDMFLL